MRAFRAQATRLARRLERGALADAAHGGLQDSAPRAALLSLHARADGVGPGSWEDPALAQIWFRWSDYVVPRTDVDVFTLGTMPRDPAAFAALDSLGQAIAGTLGGAPPTPSEVLPALEGIPNGFLVRAAQSSGRFLIRWDARSLVLLPPAPTTLEPEPARLELARRYLRWLGPGSARRFARWAGVSRADAEQTWSALEPELRAVAVDGKERWLLAADEGALETARPSTGARFLPQGDPYLYPDPLAQPPEPRLVLPDVPARLRNSLSGRVMLDGDLVASWGRTQDRLTMAPWNDLPRRGRATIAEEAERMADPIGKPMRVTWLRS